MLDPKSVDGIANIEVAGPSWDMWAFGCVVVELLGLPHPFSVRPKFWSDRNRTHS